MEEVYQTMRRMIFVFSLMLLVAFTASAARIICGPGSGLPCIVSNGPGTNDSESSVEFYLSQALGVATDITLYGKSDDNHDLFLPDPIAGKDGTWEVIDGTLIKYITIKGGNEYQIFDVGDVSSGIWSTADLLNPGGRQPDVSHITFWIGEPDNPGPLVPEPSTLALMGLGLATVGFIGRKRA